MTTRQIISFIFLLCNTVMCFGAGIQKEFISAEKLMKQAINSQDTCFAEYTVQYLLEQKANPKMYLGNGCMTILEDAAQKNKSKIVSLLVEARADVNASCQKNIYGKEHCVLSLILACMVNEEMCQSAHSTHAYINYKPTLEALCHEKASIDFTAYDYRINEEIHRLFSTSKWLGNEVANMVAIKKIHQIIWIKLGGDMQLHILQFLLVGHDLATAKKEYALRKENMRVLQQKMLKDKKDKDDEKSDEKDIKIYMV